MAKKDVEVGEIVLVPVDNGEYRLGKVLYLSQRYKDVILLALYNVTVAEATLPLSLPPEHSLLVYTSQVPIQKKRWLSVGGGELRENEKGLARRIVGGQVWLEDQELGPAGEKDNRTLPRMQVLGAGLVEKKARSLRES